jgi:hypothetical protein
MNSVTMSLPMVASLLPMAMRPYVNDNAVPMSSTGTAAWNTT